MVGAWKTDLALGLQVGEQPEADIMSLAKPAWSWSSRQGAGRTTVAGTLAVPPILEQI